MALADLEGPRHTGEGLGGSPFESCCRAPGRALAPWNLGSEDSNIVQSSPSILGKHALK